MNRKSNENSQKQRKEAEGPKAERQSPISQVEKSEDSQAQSQDEGVDEIGKKSSTGGTSFPMKEPLPNGKDDVASGGIIPFWPMMFPGWLCHQ